MSLTVERSFHLAIRPRPQGGYQRTLALGPKPSKAPEVARVPRLARLMALAIHADQLLRSSAVADATAMAALGHITQPRMTQILNLTLLAPDIQEALLFLPAVATGRPQITERDLRRLCAEVDWKRQREQFTALLTQAQHRS